MSKEQIETLEKRMKAHRRKAYALKKEIERLKDEEDNASEDNN